MALTVGDRVRETTQTTGTGTLILDGAATGFQSFSQGIGSGNECPYVIVDLTTGDWETGRGTFTVGASNHTLSRDTVYDSSNLGSKVDFQSGEKEVFVSGLANVVQISGTAVSLEDDVKLDLGDSSDYWFIYDSSGTQFRLRSTDTDGGGTDGDIFTVQDGTDDVSFAGSVTVTGSLLGASIDAGLIDSGTLADARVAESNVTQHEAAIDHDALLNFAADEHRPFPVDTEANRPAAGTQGRYFYNTTRSRLEFDNGHFWQVVSTGASAEFETLFSYTPGDDSGTFSRASVASYTPLPGDVAEAASGVLRDSHYVLEENGLLVRSTKLEASRTVENNYSADFSQADWAIDAEITRSDATSIIAGETASKLDDDGTAGSKSVRQTFGTLTGNDETAVAIVEKGNHTAIDIGLYDTNAGSFLHLIRLDLDDGSVTTEAGAGSFRSEKITDTGPNGGAVWRVEVTGSGTGGNNRRIFFYPTTAGQVAGHCFLHYIGHEEAAFGSSPIVTAGSSVTRSADDLSYDISGTPLATPQEMTVYVKFVERGTISTAGARLLGIRKGDNTGNAFEIHEAAGSGLYRLGVGADGSFVSTDVSPGPSLNDVVELRATWQSDGTLQLHQSVNGGSETSSTTVTGSILSSWDGTSLFVNDSEFADNDGFNDFIALKIAPGVRTMDEMRALAGDGTQLTGTVPDTRLSSNVPLLDDATWALASGLTLDWNGDTNLYRSGAGVLKTDDTLIVGGSDLRIGVDSTFAQLWLIDGDANADEGKYETISTAGFLRIRTRSDVEAVGSTPFEIGRTGNAVDYVALVKDGGNVGIGTDSPGGALDVQGGDVIIGTDPGGSQDLRVGGSGRFQALVVMDGGAHMQEITTPTNASTGYNKLYFKSDGNLYKLDDAGNEAQVDGAGGLTDDAWVARLVDSPNGTPPVSNLEDGESVEITVVVPNGETLKVYRWGAYRVSDGTAPTGLDVELLDGSDTVQATANTTDNESTTYSSPVASHANSSGSASVFKLRVANDTGSTEECGGHFAYIVD